MGTLHGELKSFKIFVDSSDDIESIRINTRCWHLHHVQHATRGLHAPEYVITHSTKWHRQGVQ